MGMWVSRSGAAMLFSIGEEIVGIGKEVTRIEVKIVQANGSKVVRKADITFYRQSRSLCHRCESCVNIHHASPCCVDWRDEDRQSWHDQPGVIYEIS